MLVKTIVHQKYIQRGGAGYRKLRLTSPLPHGANGLLKPLLSPHPTYREMNAIIFLRPDFQDLVIIHVLVLQ